MTALKEFSDSLAERTSAARAFVAEIRSGHSSHRSGTLWRPDVVVTSEPASVLLIGSALGAPILTRPK